MPPCRCTRLFSFHPVSGQVGAHASIHFITHASAFTSPTCRQVGAHASTHFITKHTHASFHIISPPCRQVGRCTRLFSFHHRAANSMYTPLFIFITKHTPFFISPPCRQAGAHVSSLFNSSQNTRLFSFHHLAARSVQTSILARPLLRACRLANLSSGTVSLW